MSTSQVFSIIHGVGDPRVRSSALVKDNVQYKDKPRMTPSPFFNRILSALLFFLPLISYIFSFNFCMYIYYYYKSKNPKYLFGVDAFIIPTMRPIDFNFNFTYYIFFPGLSLLEGTTLLLLLQYYWISSSSWNSVQSQEDRNMIAIYLSHLTQLVFYHISTLLYGWIESTYVFIGISFAFIFQLIIYNIYRDKKIVILLLIESILLLIEVSRVQYFLTVFEFIVENLFQKYYLQDFLSKY